MMILVHSEVEVTRFSIRDIGALIQYRRKSGRVLCMYIIWPWSLQSISCFDQELSKVISQQPADTFLDQIAQDTSEAKTHIATWDYITS